MSLSVKVNITPIKPDPTAILSPHRENTRNKETLQAMEKLEQTLWLDWQLAASTSSPMEHSNPQISFADSSSWPKTATQFSEEPESFQRTMAANATYDAFLGGPSHTHSSRHFDTNSSSVPEMDAASLFLAEVEEQAKWLSNPPPAPVTHIPGEFDEFSPALPMYFSSDEAAVSSDEEMS